MKRRSGPVLLLLVLLAACSGKEPELNERRFPLRGRIVGRDAAQEMLTIQHEEVKGFMEAMTMPFPVRGTRFSDLPPDGTKITATLHVTDRSYWVSDIRVVR